MAHTISIVRGEQPDVVGVELDNPMEDQPVYGSDLPQTTQQWIAEHIERWQGEYSDAWVLVTPSGAHANATNVLATHTA